MEKIKQDMPKVPFNAEQPKPQEKSLSEKIEELKAQEAAGTITEEGRSRLRLLQQKSIKESFRS